jgi:hypothetical protein
MDKFILALDREQTVQGQYFLIKTETGSIGTEEFT